MSEIVQVLDSELQVREVGGQRVVTLADSDRVHGRVGGTARNTFNRDKDRFVEGRHYFVRNTYEAAEMGITAPQGITLISERGYLLLVKTFGDDLAWEVQEALVDAYFRPRGDAELTFEEILADPTKMLALVGEMTRKRLELEEKIEEQAPAVEFANRVQEAEGEMSVREAAKVLQVGERWLFQWLLERKQVSRPRNSNEQGYIAQYAALRAKRLIQRVQEYRSDDGRLRITHSVRVTPKGLRWVSDELAKELEEAEA